MTSYALITDETEIRTAQRALEQAFEDRGARTATLSVGYPGGSDDARVTYLPELDLWYGHADFETRYWNLLGRGDPFATAPAIALEINPKIAGKDKRVSGAFLRAESGQVWLAHRGRVGGGRKGIGKNAFLDYLQRPRTRVGDEELILLAALDDPQLAERVEAFLGEVESFKEHAVTASAAGVDAQITPGPLLPWCQLALDWPRLEAEERSYKLKLAARLAEARRAVLSEDTAAPKLLRRAFGSPNNITIHYAHTPFLEWTREEPAVARDALVQLWDGDADAETRLSNFLERVPAEVLHGPGTRTNVAAYLLLALDPTTFPPYADTPIRLALKLANQEPDANVVEGAMYALELDLLEALRSGLAGAARDLLDVQGALWTVLRNNDFLEQLSPSNQALLKRLRQGDRSALPVQDPTQAELAPPRRMHPLNLILYGPPGTGKTYSTMKLALEICGVEYTEETRVERYRELVRSRRVSFVTFHQSFSYEDFVEGIRPVLDEETGQVHYRHESGVLREACTLAQASGPETSSAPATPPDRIWKMSLGNTRGESGTAVFSDALERNLLLLGYGAGVDLVGCDTREAVERQLRLALQDREPNSAVIGMVHRFKNEVREGDLFVISDGNLKFRAIGRARGEYLGIDPETGWLARPVEWLATFPDESISVDMVYTKIFSQRTLYRLSHEDLNAAGLQSLLAGKSTPSGTTGDAPPFVLIIDEINRANISKVLGELITLLEPDKRLGAANEQTAILPYSRKRFGVPQNLYVIGTMNTADRSIAFLDLALRRRFEFVELKPEASLLAGCGPAEVDLVRLLEVINGRIELLLDADHAIGHAYFMTAETLDDLRRVFVNRLIPQLLEYFFQDWGKVAAVLGCAHTSPSSGSEAGACALLESERLSATALLGAASDDLEDRVLYRVSRAFLEAQEEALPPFFEAIHRGGAS